MREFSENERTKLKNIINEGVQILEETNTLKDGLKDTVAAIAEELDVKPAIINRAITSAYKADLQDKQDAMSELESVLKAAGRTF